MVSAVHTHGKGGIEDFSDRDRLSAKTHFGGTLYVITPKGKLMHYDSSSEQTTTLNRQMPTKGTTKFKKVLFG